MKFLFKYATRSRPEWFKKTLTLWYNMLSGKRDYLFVVSIDTDDPTMNNPDMIRYCETHPNLKLYVGNNKDKVEAINANMDGHDFDILVIVSDDMTPVVHGYDDVIATTMQRYFPELDGALSFRDDFRSDTLITLSIMCKKLYDYFGYIYHPAYKSTWCDNEFTDVVTLLGKVIYIKETIIKHEWRKHGTDISYDKSRLDFYDDKQIYLDRKAQGFPIKCLKK